MYIKLTRLNGLPIWLNAAFIVTIEPRKDGGAIVVPIGDGLDYDVRESAEQVLEMLKEAPVAAVVPVPPPKSLVSAAKEPPAPKTEDARNRGRGEDAASTGMVGGSERRGGDAASTGMVGGSERRGGDAASTGVAPAVEEPPKKRATRGRKKAEVVESVDGVKIEEKKPAVRKTRSKAKVEAKIEAKAEGEGAKVEAKAEGEGAEVVPPVPASSLAGVQLERLRKMAPRSMRKLVNTLVTQFGVADVDATIAALNAQGVIRVEHEHIHWQPPPPVPETFEPSNVEES